MVEGASTLHAAWKVGIRGNSYRGFDKERSCLGNVALATLGRSPEAPAESIPLLNSRAMVSGAVVR